MTIVSSGFYTISSGTETGDGVLSGGILAVESGGGTLDAAILSGGSMDVGGGDARGTQVWNGGMLELDYGTAEATVVSEGGSFDVYNFNPGTGSSLASGVTVVSGGTLSVETGGVASAVTLDNGAELLIGGGAAYVTGGTGAETQIVFEDGSSTLALANAAQFSGTILSFGTSNTIDFRGFAAGAGEHAVFTEAPGYSGGTLTLISGTASASLAVEGYLYTSADFVLSGDGSGGTRLTVVSGAIVPQIVGPQDGGQGLAGAFGYFDFANVSSGEVDSGDIVLHGGDLDVESGGSASATTVFSGGILSLVTGAAASGSVISSGGELDLYTASTSLLSNLVLGEIAAAETYQNVLVAAGGSIGGVVVEGSATALTANAGGFVFVTQSASLTDSVFLSGSDLDLDALAAVSGITASSGSEVDFSNAGPLDNFVIGIDAAPRSLGGVSLLAGADLSLDLTGAGSGLVVSSAGFLEIGSGGSVSGLTVLAGGFLDLDSASLGNATIESGGIFDENQIGATTSGVTVNAGGSTEIAIAGSLSDQVVGKLATAVTLSGITVEAGAALNIDLYGVGSGLIVSSGGGLTVSVGAASFVSGSFTEPSPGSAIGTLVESGGVLTNEGVILDTVVSSGGIVEALANEATSATVSTTVLAGGSLDVWSGGVASATTLAAGGLLNLSGGIGIVAAAPAGGLIDFALDGSELMLANPTQFAGTVSGLEGNDLIDLAGFAFTSAESFSFASAAGGGTLTVSSGTARAAIRLSGAYVAGDFALHTDFTGGTFVTAPEVSGILTPVIPAGDLRIVAAGQSDSGFTVLSGGTIEVLAGGTTQNTTVSSGGIETLGSVSAAGGVADGSLIEAGGTEFVYAGGVTSGATLSGGRQEVGAGGAADGTVVVSGGGEAIGSGGLASASVLKAGGVEKVKSGGDAFATSVGYGGVEKVQSGGLAKNTLIEVGGTEKVAGGGKTKNTTVDVGGRLVVALGGVLKGALDLAGGSATIAGTAGAKDTVDFTGSGGQLALAAATPFAGTISGFATGDKFDLGGFNYTGSGSEKVHFTKNAGGTGGVLTLTSGTSSATLTLAGSYKKHDFALSTDGAGGTFIAYVSSGAALTAPAASPQLHLLVAAIAGFETHAAALGEARLEPAEQDHPMLVHPR